MFKEQNIKFCTTRYTTIISSLYAFRMFGIKAVEFVAAALAIRIHDIASRSSFHKAESIGSNDKTTNIFVRSYVHKSNVCLLLLIEDIENASTQIRTRVRSSMTPSPALTMDTKAFLRSRWYRSNALIE